MSKIQIWKRITTPYSVGISTSSLYLICQRYKFESESQHCVHSCLCYVAVFNMSKIQIWKRITTARLAWFTASMLYLICQRYKFESESQPCARMDSRAHAVFNMSKIQIWKRITTCKEYSETSSALYLICQRYKFESESQPSGTISSLHSAVFNMSKIQIWKRITTTVYSCKKECMLYLICQRYKFESESQLNIDWFSSDTRCI